MKQSFYKVLQPICRLVARCVVLPLASAINLVRALRITPIYTARLGHLALNSYLYVADRKINGPEKGVYRIFFGANPCNRTLFELWKRKIPIIESRVLTLFFMFSEDILSRIPVFSFLPHEIGRKRVRNAHQVLHRAGGVLSFSKSEDARGRRYLEEIGLKLGDWFVCFQSRDAAYHHNRVGVDAIKQGNSNIESYVKAAITLKVMNIKSKSGISDLVTKNYSRCAFTFPY